VQIQDQPKAVKLGEFVQVLIEATVVIVLAVSFSITWGLHKLPATAPARSSCVLAATLDIRPGGWWWGSRFRWLLAADLSGHGF
jgi:hypothetical protein